MSNLITLADFHAETAQYYVYKRSESPISHMPHYHDYYQIGYVVSGQVLHSQGNDAVTLNAGDGFILPPGFMHRLRFVDKDTELYCLTFHQSVFQTDFLQSNAFRFLQDLQANYDAGTIPLCLTLDTAQCQTLEALFKCLLLQQSADTPAELSAAPSMISAIVYLLAQCYYRDPGSKRQPWNSADDALLLRRCIAYVDTHYTETLSIEELSKQFGLSRSVLCSAFQQRTGLSLHKYIARKRIQKAQNLIQIYPNLPLSEVADRIGYADSSTFYRNFLRQTGISPAQYRELCHGSNGE